MKITMMALGSRGDVQPYVALGQGLQQAGHQVRLMAQENFESFVRSYGLDFCPAKGDVRAFMESPEARKMLDDGKFLKIMKHGQKALREVVLDWARDGLAACSDADLIVAGLGGLYMAHAFSDKLGIPLAQAYLVPFTPTKALPGPLVPPHLGKLGGTVNKLSHHLTRQMMWQSSRSAENYARREALNVPPAPFWGPYKPNTAYGAPILYGFSPSVIAQPTDWVEPIHVTGYWFLDSTDDWTPPEGLEAFLQAGAPPVYIGFGSMRSRDPKETADLVLNALAQTGQRAILMSGWGGLQAEDVPDSVLMVDSIPHSWLFPRMAAVVHHGGAGTTAAGLRAGVPSVIIPFFGDQPFWGDRVEQLGVGPTYIPRKKLTVDGLAKGIQTAVTDSTMRQKAAQLGERIRAEDGVGRAVNILQQTVGDIKHALIS